MVFEFCFLLLLLLVATCIGVRGFWQQENPMLAPEHGVRNVPPIYATKRHSPPNVIPKSLAWYMNPKNRYYDAKAILPMQLLDTSDLEYDAYLLGPGIETLKNLQEYRTLASLLEANAFHPSKLAS